jgi:SAM-dependent methyltransferase
MKVPGNQGYEVEAPDLIERYEQLDFAEVHAPVLHFLPNVPCEVLDVGAGTGRDAAYLAARGYRVTAIEPTDALRAAGMKSHAHGIRWLDDGLPELASVSGEQFDLAMLTAVWMHLDARDRARAMPVIASLLRNGATLLMSLRHGPVPPGRRMFEVGTEETIALAQAQGLKCLFKEHRQSIQTENRLAGVSWTHLAFSKIGSLLSESA